MGEAHDYEELAQQMAENDRQVRQTPASPTPRVFLRTHTTTPSSCTGAALALTSCPPPSQAALAEQHAEVQAERDKLGAMRRARAPLSPSR